MIELPEPLENETAGQYIVRLVESGIIENKDIQLALEKYKNK